MQCGLDWRSASLLVPSPISMTHFFEFTCFLTCASRRKALWEDKLGALLLGDLDAVT